MHCPDTRHKPRPGRCAVEPSGNPCRNVETPDARWKAGGSQDWLPHRAAEPHLTLVCTPWLRLCCSVGQSSRSEEHTSELQSLRHLACRLLLETGSSDIYTLSLHAALPIWLPHRAAEPHLTLVCTPWLRLCCSVGQSS